MRDPVTEGLIKAAVQRAGLRGAAIAQPSASFPFEGDGGVLR